MRYISTLDSLGINDIALVGGKKYLYMIGSFFKVPEVFVLTAERC